MFLCAAGVVASACVSPVAGAFSYGTIPGVNVVYEEVQEDSNTDPEVQLYGEPVTAGNALEFSPVSFGAYATGVGGIDLTDGTLAAAIVAKANNVIEKVQFAEAGDWTLAGNGTRATNASVSASLFVRVVEIDGVSVDPISLNADLTFSPSDGTYNLVEDPGFTEIWTGGIEVDVSAMIAAAGNTGKATKVLITLDNSLCAASEAGTVAHIKKKEINGLSITAIIPEPATLCLLAAGALWVGRRRCA